MWTGKKIAIPIQGIEDTHKCGKMVKKNSQFLARYLKKFYPIKILIELIEVLSHTTVNVIPPVADENGLVEHRTSRTQEAVLPTVKMAVMVNLKN